MKRRTLLAGSAALAAGPLGLARPAVAQARTRIVWWHAMTATNAEQVARIVQQFNAAQNEAEVQRGLQGHYPETLTAAIAAFRAGQAPHLVQIFEVGTGSMLAAGRAVKQVWQLSQDTGVPIDPAQFIPAVRGYYSLADGRLASMPFNSSTAVIWYNKDAFEKAGLDPEQAAGDVAGNRGRLPGAEGQERDRNPDDDRSGRAGSSSSSTAPSTICPMRARRTASRG